jgi:hypothetical protein
MRRWFSISKAGACSAETFPVQRGFIKSRFVEDRSIQVCPTQIGASQVGPFQVCAAEVRVT